MVYLRTPPYSRRFPEFLTGKDFPSRLKDKLTPYQMRLLNLAAAFWPHEAVPFSRRITLSVRDFAWKPFFRSYSVPPVLSHNGFGAEVIRQKEPDDSISTADNLGLTTGGSSLRGA